MAAKNSRIREHFGEEAAAEAKKHLGSVPHSRTVLTLNIYDVIDGSAALDVYVLGDGVARDILRVLATELPNVLEYLNTKGE